MENVEHLAIISRFNEDISWVSYLKIPHVIYNKGEKIPEDSIEIPNIGRESETFVRYIVSNYNNLPKNCTFLQGNPFDHFRDVLEIINNVELFENFVFLADNIYFSDINGLPHHELNLEKILNLLGIKNNFKLFQFGAGAQFTVSRDLILNRPLDWWVKLYELHSSEPNLPWILERLWKVIFLSPVSND
jgi:hypothetical protein